MKHFRITTADRYEMHLEAENITDALRDAIELVEDPDDDETDRVVSIEEVRASQEGNKS